MSRLPEGGTKALNYLLYDDACHLKKFSENPKRANKNKFTKDFAEIPKAVDNFHLKNHVDKWCHKFCNPKDIRALDGVNTESCEQTIKWVNNLTSVKSMNASLFLFFFLFVFHYHNMNKQNRLRSEAHPKSELRWDLLEDLKDWEETLLDDPSNTENVANLVEVLGDLDIGCTGSSLKCKYCGAQYKKQWTLNSHITKKHSEQNECTVCQTLFSTKEELQHHMTSHNMVCETCNKTFSCFSSLKDT